MKMKIEIFEPALCCASGICGPEPDKALIELQNVVQTLTAAGIDVKRYAINQAAIAFVSNPVVKQFIRTEGTDKLPLTLIDGQIIKKKSYPSLEELSAYIPDIKNLVSDGKR
jgi:hypothetical protein